MSEIFFISDLHLGHKNILNFKREDGSPLRDFKDVDHMHQVMISNWERVVSPQDKVYVLGDVAFKPEALKLIGELPGKKRLVMGNHDLMDVQVYTKYFQKVFGVRQLNGVWLTHVPMHEGSVMQKRVLINVHGHLHSYRINNPKYFNACVECIDYTPVHLDKVLKQVK